MFRVPTSAFRVGGDSVNQQVDLLAIAAHRDDAELTCGGTLAKVARAGQRVGILDLTQGEMGSRGDAATRAAEAERAAQALGVHLRRNAELRDAYVQNDESSRKKTVELIRELRPRVVILPYPVGRHPDHRIASELARDACYLAGQDLYELIRVQSDHYGSLIRKPYGEPFFTLETLEVDDVLRLGVQSL